VPKGKSKIKIVCPFKDGPLLVKPFTSLYINDFHYSLYINDFHYSSDLFDFHLFADDANLFCENESLQMLQNRINSELNNIHTWLSANRLSLNIEKSNFILFHPPQKRFTGFHF